MEGERELKPVQPRWCGDTRVHATHQWIDKENIPQLEWKPGMEIDKMSDVTIPLEICRGVRPQDRPRGW